METGIKESIAIDPINIKIINTNRGSIGIANEKKKSENKHLLALLSASIFTLISALSLWGNSRPIKEKSVPTILIAKKNMSVSGVGEKKKKEDSHI